MEQQYEQEVLTYPVYKALTRSPTIFGVPMMPLIAMTMVVAIIALSLSIFWWALWPVLCFVMAQITKYDDKAFRIISLWIDTKVLNGNKTFWGASSYSPIKRKKRKLQ